MLSDPARSELVKIVRDALDAAVNGKNFEPQDPKHNELLAQGGCFVTYKTNGRLRGCIGCFESGDPLYKTVAHYARLSALEDPRFAADRIRPDELAQISLDISVLSPLEPCDSPEDIQLGVHGIYVKSGWRSGCFLPQVATETGWSIEEFWGNCCSHKAGLPHDAWKSPDIEKFIFTAEVIEDKP